MSRVESYTSGKIVELIAGEATARDTAISLAIAAEKIRSDSAYKVADYVVVRDTGTQADIQAVFDIAETSGGGSVHIPKGVWSIVTPLLIPSNISLTLSPGAIIRRAASIPNLMRNKANGTTGGYTANQDITIIGGEWDGNTVAFPGIACVLIAIGHANNIAISNCEMYGVATGNHIKIAAVSNAVIRDCTFNGVSGSATQDELSIEGMYSSTAFSFFGPYDNYPCIDLLVEGCTFSGGAYGIGTRTGVAGHWHSNIRVIGNHFTTVTTRAINLVEYNQLIIDNNTFLACGIGVYITTLVNQINAGISISNNIFRDLTGRASTMQGATLAGLYLRRILYLGNIIRGSDAYGIYDDNVAGVSYNSNVISSCQGIGIKSTSVQNATFTANQCDGNNLSGDSLGADVKIGDVTEAVNDSNDITIVSNYIGVLYIRSANNVITGMNSIRTTYTVSGTAPVPVDVHNIANFVNGSFVA